MCAAGQTTLQPGSPDDNAAVSAAYNHLHAWLPIGNQLYFDADEHPVAGSELASAKQDADLYVAHSLAGILFQAAEDHLLLVLQTFIGGVIPRYGLYTAVRGALEASAWCCWLEEPGISETNRVGRALTERITSIRELNKLGKAPKFVQQVTQMRGVADKYHLEAIPMGDGSPEPYAFGAGRPRVTTLLRSLLPDITAETAGLPEGAFVYKSISARAHATGWALVHGAVPIAKVNPHTTVAYITVDIPDLLRALRVAANLHARSVAWRLMLAGRSEQELDDAIADLPPYAPSL